ncbi:MFS transporter [Streptomyces sp. AK02-01A]|uniref:MFS transporter n=1 Tax=Streptomyces sp. AK02-01A TaxID=3028648 RepID=UPI0029AC363A|nr:MFS transporter [Streptomyces sp. AK02-01A]MDX3854838.1 MFS transporter [Streptomyces sp. AK02-01A]
MKKTDVSGPPATGTQPPIQWRRINALVAGQGAAMGGDYVLLIAMSWTAIQLGGASAVTTLMLAATIPRAVMLVFGGAVADRFGPRFVLLRTNAARVVLLVAGTVTVSSVRSLWPLIVIVLFDGVLFGLASPSAGSVIPHLATHDQLPRANSLYAMVSRVSPIVGSPVGAWMIATGELWEALLVAAVTCAISLGTLFVVTKGMRPPERTPGKSLVKSSGDGLRLLASHPRLRWTFVCALCLDMAFGWPIEVAMPLLVQERGWGVSAIGVIIAAFSSGALVSSATGAVLAHRIPVVVRFVVSGAGIAIGILLMALMPSVIAIAVTGCAVGIMAGLNGPAIVTVYQQAAPKAKMGAAMSTLTLASIGTGPISIALFGSLSLTIGLRTTWMVCGAVALIAPLAALAALRHPVAKQDDETAGAARPANPAEAEETSRTPAANDPLTVTKDDAKDGAEKPVPTRPEAELAARAG